MSDKRDDINNNIDDAGDKKDKSDRICYLCKRPESTAGKLVNIPNQINICADCMQKAFDMINMSDNPYMNLMGVTL